MLTLLTLMRRLPVVSMLKKSCSSHGGPKHSRILADGAIYHHVVPLLRRTNTIEGAHSYFNENNHNFKLLLD
jgi:hypothetical protein